MTPIRKKRLLLIGIMVATIGVATTLLLKAFDDNLMFFFSPSQVVAGEAPKNHAFRIGGLVVHQSVKRQPDGLTVDFALTDMGQTVKVQYTGILPDLFREGQGIVALGKPYGAARLESACRRALHFDNPRYRTVKEILKQGLDQAPMEKEAPPLAAVYTLQGRFLRGASEQQLH